MPVIFRNVVSPADYFEDQLVRLIQGFDVPDEETDLKKPEKGCKRPCFRRKCGGGGDNAPREPQPHPSCSFNQATCGATKRGSSEGEAGFEHNPFADLLALAGSFLETVFEANQPVNRQRTCRRNGEKGNSDDKNLAMPHFETEVEPTGQRVAICKIPLESPFRQEDLSVSLDEENRFVVLQWKREFGDEESQKVVQCTQRVKLPSHAEPSALDAQFVGQTRMTGPVVRIACALKQLSEPNNEEVSQPQTIPIKIHRQSHKSPEEPNTAAEEETPKEEESFEAIGEDEKTLQPEGE